jgi:multicomponent K+:H+ antiporter subunit E
MKRRPLLLAASLAAFWLVLNDSLQPTDLMVAIFVALAVPPIAARLRPSGPAVRRPFVLARLVLRVGGDVLMSGLQVARGALRPPQRPPAGSFVTVPLDLRDPHALAALAVITTAVPGSVWSELAPDHSAVLLHIFGVDDPQEFVRTYKMRYEQPLREIFES